MTDESTDISVLNQLVNSGKIYIIPSGNVETSFVHMCNIADGKAETIEGEVMAYIQNSGIDINKIRFGSDGASVMMGKHNHVAAKLKSHQPHLLSIHCINHRLALAAANAADDTSLIFQKESLDISLIQPALDSSIDSK